jgi:hypothetical protein
VTLVHASKAAPPKTLLPDNDSTTSILHETDPVVVYEG